MSPLCLQNCVEIKRKRLLLLPLVKKKWVFFAVVINDDDDDDVSCNNTNYYNCDHDNDDDDQLLLLLCGLERDGWEVRFCGMMVVKGFFLCDAWMMLHICLELMRAGICHIPFLALFIWISSSSRSSSSLIDH